LPVWEFQLGWKKDQSPQKLPLATATSAVGRRVTKPPWGWLFSTATVAARTSFEYAPMAARFKPVILPQSKLTHYRSFKVKDDEKKEAKEAAN
jgi:hypothetical protein